MTAATLRLFRDRLDAAQTRALPPAPRVLYAQGGDVGVVHGGAPTSVAVDSAWFGSGACEVRGNGVAVTVLRWELVAATARRDGELVLEQAMELDAGASWLMRCDRVDFDPGGVAWPHRHRGGGIRCLV